MQLVDLKVQVGSEDFFDAEDLPNEEAHAKGGAQQTNQLRQAALHLRSVLSKRLEFDNEEERLNTYVCTPHAACTSVSGFVCALQVHSAECIRPGRRNEGV